MRNLLLWVSLSFDKPLERSVIMTYIVQPGDSLYEIAMRYDISLRELIQVNGITAPYIIYPGQSIIIPGVPIDAIIKLNNIPRPDLIYPGQRLLIPRASAS